MSFVVRLALVLAMGAASASAAELTAVYTLDAKQAVFAPRIRESLAQQVAGWAEQCRIVPGGAIFVLECPERSAGSDVRESGVDVNLVLFRDLDETVYLASCPNVDGIEDRLREEERAEPQDEERDEERLRQARDCADLAAGQTFSAETEDREIRIVLRGRQLPLRVQRVQPKRRYIRTPYELEPSSGGLPHAGPVTSATIPPLEGPPPEWKPPEEPVAAVGARPARAALRDVGPAKTSLRTGTVTIECGDPAAAIFVDAAFLGRGSLQTPIIAGRHELLVQRPGQERETVEFEIEAGETLRLTVCR